MSIYRDPLVVLAACRRNLVALKSHDFAARRPNAKWPEATHEVLSLTDGKPVTMLSREDYNARQRAFERRHTAWPRYELARLRAMRPVAGRLRQAEMLAVAARCVSASERLRERLAA